MTTVDESWARIVAWSREHAPATVATLGPPATGADIAAVERVLGVALPADLEALYRNVNGMSDPERFPAGLLPPYCRLLSIREGLDTRQGWLGVFAGEEYDEDLEDDLDITVAGTAGGRWRERWMPIAADTGFITVFVDLRDGPSHGCVMDFDKVDGADREVGWPGVTAMLTEVADALDHDLVVHGYRPEVDGYGRLGWRPAPSPR